LYFVPVSDLGVLTGAHLSLKRFRYFVPLPGRPTVITAPFLFEELFEALVW
jgi:hypothetical protein